MNDINLWLPSNMFMGVDRSYDRQTDTTLRGVCLPLPLHEHRRIAARPLEPVRSEHARVWLKNIMTVASRDYVYSIDSISEWENEGGR